MLVVDHPVEPIVADAATATDVVPAAGLPRARPSAAAWVAVLIAVVPVVVDPAGWFVYVTARWAVLAAVVTIAVAALAVRGRLRLPAGSAWWIALVGVAVVSASASDAPWVALTGASDRRMGAMTWAMFAGAATVGASVARGPGSVRVIVRGVSLAGLLTGLVTAAQQAGLDWPAGAVNAGRPGGPFGNADFLGAFGVLALLAAIGAALDDEEGEPWRIVHVGGATAAAFCLVVSGARAAWLGAVVGLVVLAVSLARRRGATVRTTVALGVALGLLATGLLLLAGGGSRLATVADAASGRAATWEVTLRSVGSRPVLGWGPEGLAEGFGRSATAVWERTYSRRLVPDRAHNGLLDVLATLGVVGLLAYVGVIGVTVRAVRRWFRSDRHPPVAALGVAAALVGYLVQQQFLFQLPDVDLVAALLAGALGGCAAGAAAPASLSAAPVAPAVTGDDRSSPRARSWAPTAVVTLVVVAVVGSVVWIGALVVAADRDARVASDRRSVPAATASIERDPQALTALVLADAALARGSADDLGAARRRLGAVRAATFDDGRLTLARARLARASGFTSDLSESEAEVRDLLAVDRARADAWVELGELSAAQFDERGAADAFARAVALRPDRTDAWLGLARAEMALGHVRSAAAAIARVPVDQLDASGLALRSAATGLRSAATGLRSAATGPRSAPSAGVPGR